MRHDVRLMGGTGTRIALGILAALASFGLIASAASAGATIQSDPNAYDYLPGPFVQDLGETAIFDNSQSSAPHDVTTARRGPDGGPLFYSNLISGGQTTPVKGTEYLAAGTYPFYCTIHGTSMSGELVIDGSKGTVVPRPSIKATFPGQRLKQVRKSGVRVKVKATTASNGVAVTARKGRALLGVKRGLNFTAGQSRTVTVPLTKAGRKAISKGKVVKITVKATVEFGKPSTAIRKVR